MLAILGTALAFAVASQGHGQTPPLKKVKFGVGTLVMNLTYPWASMPLALGYWRRAGYDVDVFASQSSLQSIQLLNAGNVDFVESNSAPILQAEADNKVALRTVMVNTVIDWSLVSNADGPIKKVQDFKGKTIGVSSLGTGGAAFLNSYLGTFGLKPNVDFTMVAVGVGPAPLEALRSGRVDGLMYWGSAISGFEVAGAKFNYFFDPKWRKYADFSMAAMKSTVDRDPAMVVAIVRGAAMGSLFAVTNPDCVRRVFWAKFPEGKPTGADEATLIKGDLHRLDGQIDGMKQALDIGGGKLWGNATARNYGELQDFMVDTKVLKTRLANPADYIVDIPDFFQKVNDFDHDAVIGQAKDCKVP